MDWLYACFLFFSWASEGQRPADWLRGLERDVTDWLHVASWLSEVEAPDDCWDILDYDLAEWPQGITAVEMCMNRFPLHYERPHRENCDTWNELLGDREGRLKLARDLHYTELEMFWMAVAGWEADECHKTRREELLFYAERQKATREAEWRCCFATMDDNLRRMKLGLRETDEYHYCWGFSGGDGWKKFYEGPT